MNIAGGRKLSGMDSKKNILALHNDIVEQFDNNKRNVEKFKERCKLLRKEIQELEAVNFDSLERQQRMSLFEKRNELKEKELVIQQVSDGVAELEYMTKALPLLARYCELVKTEIVDIPLEDPEDDDDTRQQLSSNFSSFVSKYGDLEINHVRSEYMSLVDPGCNNDYNKINPMHEYSDFCECPNSNFVRDNECNVVCTTCGVVVDSMALDFTNVSFQESQAIDMSKPYKYEKINHFRTKLEQLQGKENIIIPEEDMELIRAEVKRYKMTDSKKLDKEFIKYILKKCKLNKKKNYNAHTTYIIQQLSGEKPEQMTAQMEQTLEYMFLRTLAPFQKYKPKTRKNYNGFEYTIFKLCQLKGWDRFLCNLKLPKSKDIRQDHDKVWRKICDDLGWCFYDTTGE